jgi:CelD/BcsL family acetyltransferase involved in cellulose biosynthesis
VTGPSVHLDWNSVGFELEPVAGRVGPFPRAPFLEAWAGHRANGAVEIVEGSDALMVLHVVDGVVEFAGDENLTDYHSPLGEGSSELLASYASGRAGRYSFDSLPCEAAEHVEKGLTLAGLVPRCEQHEAAAVLELADTWEGVMESLDKKKRHELRRKRRRFEEQVGAPVLERRHGDDAVAAFSDLHRSAGGDKARFMTKEMEAFFAALHRDAGGVIDFLVAGGRHIAAAFGFEDQDTYYLYNSGFDTAHAGASPGIVLVELLMRQAVSSGRDRFDFLKGEETYKFRLGASARPLYRVAAEAS